MNGNGRMAFATELARHRAEAQLSLAEVAAAAHVARGYVHHIEHGRRWPSRPVVQALDAVVGANGALLTMWRDAQESTGKRATPLRDQRLPVEPLLPPMGAVDTPLDVKALRAMAYAFQAADRQVGGGRLYPALMRLLHAEIAPALIDSRGDGSDDLFTAAASLTELAGWMAHDAGADEAARNHFGRAYRLATAAGSGALAGSVCASMAHLASQLGQCADAVRIAEVGLNRAAAADGAGRLVARLHVMRAHGLALGQQGGDGTAALDAAECALDAAAGTEHAEWIAQFDEGALAGETALCLLEIGDPVGAERAARRVIELRSGDRVRSRAFGQLTLARVLVHTKRTDEAATVGRAVCDVAPSLASARVRTQLAGLGRVLRPYRAGEGVADFLDQLATLDADTTSNGASTWPV